MKMVHIADPHRLAVRWVLWRHNALFQLGAGDDEIALANSLGLDPEEFEVETHRLPEDTRIVASGAPEYPAALYELERPPPFVYIRGASVPDYQCVAVVGTREATFDDEALTHEFVVELVNFGAHIISGGAIGIDIAAHRAALSLAQPTTVVLPGGVDVSTPARHRDDFVNVLEHGGTLVSLQPLGTRAFKSLYAPRNALLSALASQVVVVRSGPTGGTMITVEIAKRLGRPIFAVPGDPREKTALGCLELLRTQVAKPAWSASHVLGESASSSSLSVVATKITNAIRMGRDHLDALIEDIDEDLATVHQTILELEFMGVITRLHGRYVCASVSKGELT